MDFFSSRRRHTRYWRDWSSDVCSSDLTAKDAENLRNIRAEVEKRGYRDVPLVADVHFNPNAAMEAAKWADKVRVNPGNFADAKKFATKDYTYDEYQRELERIEQKFKPLVLRCKELG